MRLFFEILILRTFSLILICVGRTSGDFSVYEVDLHSSDIARRRACAPVSTIPNATYYSTLTVFNSAMNMQSVRATSDGGKQCCTN